MLDISEDEWAAEMANVTDGSAKSIVNQFKVQKDFLSQEEVDALLKGVTEEEDEPLSFEEWLTGMKQRLETDLVKAFAEVDSITKRINLIEDIYYKFKGE